MKFLHFFFFSFLFTTYTFAQVSTFYTISFENAIHHEANVEVIFKNIQKDTATFRMSRSSPGRYALHEFAKNVYSVSAKDKNGKELRIFRTDPYSWHVSGHGGEIIVHYTLFANHADGTYSQIDETHAHLNMPATFMFMSELQNDSIEVNFRTREDLNWKIATQLPLKVATTYSAPDLQYFMDSPTEISDLRFRSFKIDSSKNETIEIALHDASASESDFDEFAQSVEKIVREQEMVFGELPNYDYGKYTFLACYMPQNSGDAMEHRNSTSLSSTRSLSEGGKTSNLGGAAHEFFHCWNVERIRPAALEPFDFTAANMSGELWFAEGFTNYFDGLTMARAGVQTKEDFIKSLSRTFNFVWNSSGRSYFNPIEMSYQAPFVDAATSVDQTNRANTFISYYSYGDMLGLALDLKLRMIDKDLDSFMETVWKKFGKNQNPYNVEDLRQTLEEFSSQEFANEFFDNYIYQSKMPDFKPLFNNVGVDYKIEEKPSFGVSVKDNLILYNPSQGSTAYNAGLQKDDKIIRIDDTSISNEVNPNTLVATRTAGDSINITYERYGRLRNLETKVESQTNYRIELIKDDVLSEEQKENRSKWLSSKTM